MLMNELMRISKNFSLRDKATINNIKDLELPNLFKKLSELKQIDNGMGLLLPEINEVEQIIFNFNERLKLVEI